MPSAKTQQLQDRAKALLTAQPTAKLVTSLLLLDADITADREVGNLDDAGAKNLTRHWLIAELERRHPEVEAVLDAAFTAAEEDLTLPDVDYVAVLTAAIPL